MSTCLQQDEQSSGQHKELHKSLLSLQRCPLPRELEGPHHVQQIRQRWRMARCDLWVVPQTCTHCDRNCFFPSAPKKVEQLLNKPRQRDPSSISEGTERWWWGCLFTLHAILSHVFLSLITNTGLSHPKMLLQGSALHLLYTLAKA